MSLTRVIVTDKTTVLTGEIHCSEAKPIIASLSSEPETVEEFGSALKRFRPAEAESLMEILFRRRQLTDPFNFLESCELKPFDAGITVIDLAGRTLLSKSRYSSASFEGTIHVEDRLSENPSATGFPLPFRIPEDWKIVDSISEFESKAVTRRRVRQESEPKDYRSVLYGDPMLRFFARRLLKIENPSDKEIVPFLHSAWLMTSREELDGKSPREVIHEKRDFIDFDLHSRSLQYSFTKDCPPDLSSDSHAFRYAGFGTHEIVVYYDLVRFLITNLQMWIAEDGPGTLDSEVSRLRKLRDQWLREPDPEYSGRTPNSILEAERKRRNLTMSAAESIIDEDCPICVEMSQIFDTPMFWHLDGSKMDDHFAFSFHDSVEEYEQEKAAWESHLADERRQAINEEALLEISDDPDEFLALLRGEVPW